MNIQGSWITLNRACNIACKWCYAKDTKNIEMKFDDVIKLLDFLKEIGVKRVILLGGEPTLYFKLTDVIKAATERGIRTALITNGIKLADKTYCHELAEAGLNSVNISLKGYDRESYYGTAQVDKYLDALNGISNASQFFEYDTVSFVLSSDNILSINNGIRDAVKAGAKNIGLSFCYNFDACHSDAPITVNFENPYTLAYLFKKSYEDICEASNGKFNLFQTLPLCVWEDSFIQKLKDNHQISTICQLLCKNGLIFDTDMTLIPCNAMYNLKLGKFGKDFNDYTSFSEFWSQADVLKLYDRLRAYPDKKCVQCDQWKQCGGGCVSNWFNYSFEDMTKLREQFEKEYLLQN